MVEFTECLRDIIEVCGVGIAPIRRKMRLIAQGRGIYSKWKLGFGWIWIV